MDHGLGCTRLLINQPSEHIGEIDHAVRRDPSVPTRRRSAVLDLLGLLNGRTGQPSEAVVLRTRDSAVDHRLEAVFSPVPRRNRSAVGQVNGGIEGDLSNEVERALAPLSDREKEVLRLRYGLGTEREYTLEEIGKRLSVTRERVRQIESRALQKLRATKQRADATFTSRRQPA